MTTPYDLGRVTHRLIQDQEKYRKMLLTTFRPQVDLSPLARQAAESMARLQNSILQPAIRTATEALSQRLYEPMPRLAKALEEQKEIERQALKRLVPRGWLLSPSLAAAAPSKILAAIEEEGIDSVENDLIRLFDPDFCKEIIDECLDRESYTVWEEKFGRALAAHRCGDFDLAIPIWLIAIDGILSAELSTEERRIEDVFTRVHRRKGLGIREAFGPTNPWTDPLLDGLIGVLREFGRSKEEESSPNPVLRRHAIMHGETADFGSERRLHSVCSGT